MSVYYIGSMPITDELYHHGIKGQRWGIRRYQNPDGTLTAAGKRRYGSIENFNNAMDYKNAKKEYSKTFDRAYNRSLEAYSISKKRRDDNKKRWEDVHDKINTLDEAKRKYKETNKVFKDKKSEARRRASRAVSNERAKELASEGKTVASTILSGVARSALAGGSALYASKKLYDIGAKSASGAMLLYGGALVTGSGIMTAYDARALSRYKGK